MARLLIQLFALQCVLFAAVHGLFGKSSVKNAVKYQLQQKVLTLGSSYTVKDDKGNSVYKIGFKQLGLGKHLQLTDVSGQKEYYAIKHILNPLGLAKYEIRQNNQVVADVKRKLNLIGGKKFSVKSKFGDYKIEGNFLSKKFFSIGDKYGVKIEYGQDQPFILALAIVIDEVAHG
ncbi:unnamed protein product [Adineta ricciae]|uniref:Uncharacterized protein n=1 Tax=Adineta ricciae TaxID=249248 RepID=A0A813Q372_ADIRI|nr:unnamed protein product [Adineta ricciae]